MQDTIIASIELHQRTVDEGNVIIITTLSGLVRERAHCPGCSEHLLVQLTEDLSGLADADEEARSELGTFVLEEWETRADAAGLIYWIESDQGMYFIGLPSEDDYENEACEGHESLRGDLMGETFYCDGSCRP